MARIPEVGTEEKEVPEIEPKKEEQIVIPRVVSSEDMLNAIYDNTQRVLDFVIPKEVSTKD